MLPLSIGSIADHGTTNTFMFQHLTTRTTLLTKNNNCISTHTIITQPTADPGLMQTQTQTPKAAPGGGGRYFAQNCLLA